MKNNFITKIIGVTLAFAMMIGGAVGINVAKQAKEVNATDYSLIATFDFADVAPSGSTSTSLNNDTIKSTLNSASSVANLVTSVTGKSGDVYIGKGSGGSGIPQEVFKIGKASGPGSFTFTIGGNDSVSKIVFNAYSWKTSTSVSVNSGTPQTYGTAATLHEFAFELASPTKSLAVSVTSSALCVASIDLYKVTSSGGGDTPITYTGVEVSQKTALTGTYKGDAYYECQATVTGTGAYSSDVAWSITSSNTYGSGTSIANKATIDTNGKITFLDNCTVYVWATAANGVTHNETGFVIAVSTLQDNPINTWTLVDDSADVTTNGIYTLSNDGASFAGNSVSGSAIAMTSSIASIGFFALEPATGGYYLRFASYDDVNGVWEADGRYVGWTGSGANMNANDSGSTVWALVEDSTGVYLKTENTRHIGLGNSVAKPYTDVNANAPLYLYEAGSLPVIQCAAIELTGAPTSDMSIGDTATLGYTALDDLANGWTGDVNYSILSESTSGVVELSATSGESVTLTAKRAGTATISVQDAAGHATPDTATITVLADPERVDLPVGSYTVTIDAANETSSTLPATRDYEIKAKEGTGANRVWYRNLTVAFNDITVLTNYDEYESAKTTGALTVTNNSNATISNVEVHYYKFLNDGVGVYVDNNMLNPTSSTGTSGTDNDLYRGYTNITGNSFALCNKNGDYTSKFYSVTITLTVVDENEEFLNLAIIKGATATSFTKGDAPNHNGLTVRENYSTDGETISRYEDVTASVTWDYSIETIGTRTRSYTVTATYGGHTSAPVTIDGFTVSYIDSYSLFNSPIVEGDYIIYYSGKALQNTISSSKATYSEIEPANNIIRTNNADIVWHIAKDGESNYYTIYNKEAGKYLASTNSNNQAALETEFSEHGLWRFELSQGKFEIVNKAREDAGSNNKYLRENTTYGFACYSSSTGGALSLYRLDVEGYLKSASAVATLTDDILRLGSSIPESVWNSVAGTGEITDYGVMIYKTDSEANITSDTPVEDAYRAGVVQPAIARTGHGNAPTAVDGNCVFTARMRVSNPDTIFCAASFMVVDGQYYFFNEQHVTAGQLA